MFCTATVPVRTVRYSLPPLNVLSVRTVVWYSILEPMSVVLDVAGIALDQATIGDTVELWGSQVSVDQVAALSGTVAYELFCRLTARPIRRLI